MNTRFLIPSVENQFVHPSPAVAGSKLIFPAPYKGWGEQGESIRDSAKMRKNKQPTDQTIK